MNAVAPGLILPPVGKTRSYLQELAHTNAMQAVGTAADITRSVDFLLQSNFVTGEVIFVDGGAHLRGGPYGNF